MLSPRNSTRSPPWSSNSELALRATPAWGSRSSSMMRKSRRTLVGCPPSAYVVDLRRDEAGFIGCQEGDHRGDLLRSSKAADRHSRLHVLHLLRSELLQDFRFDYGWSDGIYSNPLLGHLLAECLAQSDYACFG